MAGLPELSGIIGITAREEDDLITQISSRNFIREVVVELNLINDIEFYEETKKAKDLCEQIIGSSIKGYRASNWSITEDSLWALDILRDIGFIYDSSIYPSKNYDINFLDYVKRRRSLITF